MAYDGDTKTAAEERERPAFRKFMLSAPSLHRQRSAGNHSVPCSSGNPNDRYRSALTMPRWKRLCTIEMHVARAIAAGAPSVAQCRGFSVHSAFAWYLAARKSGTNAACQSLATNTGAVSKYARFMRSTPSSPPPKNKSSHGTDKTDSMAAMESNANRKSLSW